MFYRKAAETGPDFSQLDMPDASPENAAAPCAKNRADADTAPMSINIDLRHAILMIARSLDYVGIDDVNHGHRVGYIAYECAKRLGWAESRREFIYLAGLLHDCGVSSTREHDRLLGDLKPRDPEEHCVRGYDYLSRCIVLHPFALTVRYHHTPWRTLRDMPVDTPDRQSAALICLADRVDFLRKRCIDGLHPDYIVLHEQQIADEIRRHAGSLFDPEQAEAMAELAMVDGFWYTMDQGFIENIGAQLGRDGAYDMPLSITETINLARFMSQIVDAKSPFTHMHSERVAKLAAEISKDMGFSTFEQNKILIAGFLHDVGKLRIDDDILHKPEALSKEEFSVVKRHVVDTGLALKNCFPGSKIPEWAANHHEKLDGSGYPYRLRASQLDTESRIIAVADIFQALAQDRPYRGQLDFGAIMKIMVPLATDGKIDADVLDIVRRDAQRYYAIATA